MYPILPAKSLRDILIKVMSSGGTFTAEELDRRASSLYRECSKQAIYKELRALQREGVIFKASTRYGISFTWILHSLEHFDHIYDNCVGAQSVEAMLPNTEGKLSWNFTNFGRTDDFLMNAILLLFKECKSKGMYAWIPHPWFAIIHPAKDEIFRNALRATDSVMHVILGGDSFLYKYCTDTWKDDPSYNSSMAKGPFDAIRHQWYFVIEDLLITVNTEKTVADKQNTLFDTIQDIGGEDFRALLQLLNDPVKTKITIERSHQKANKYLKDFKEFFGSFILFSLYFYSLLA